jgi:dipeptidyl aminopeptidase/acylaminoacyl peptidase
MSKSSYSMLLALGWLLAGPFAHPDDLSVDDFFRPPEYETVKLSPSGKYLAVGMRRNGLKIVAVLRRDDLDLVSLVKFNPPNEVHQFEWANDERLLVAVAVTPGKVDFPIRTGEWYAVDADGSDGRMLIGVRAEPRLNPVGRAPDPSTRGNRLTSVLPGDPNHVLITTYSGADNTPLRTQVVSLDIYSGAQRRVARAPLRDAFLLADRAGRVRFAMGRDSELRYELYYRPAADTRWQRITTTQFGSGELIPIAFGTSIDTVFVSDNRHSETRGLSALDLTTGALTELFRDPRVDIEHVLVATPDDVVYGVRYVPDRVAYFVLDSAQPYAAMLRRAQREFPGASIELTSFSGDRRQSVVAVVTDRDAGTFYLYDAPSDTFTYLLRARRWLDPDRMAHVAAVDIPARDGTRLQGFWTEPIGWHAPGPLVVIPHGGPHGAKDGPLFDATNQLLAWAGYAVLTVNYRGSDGYGKAFKTAGFGEWGGLIQTDIIDATRWATEHGSADPQRIAIMGTSFGAYAAMENAILAPQLYRCAIGISGVYDLPLLYEAGDVQQRTLGLAYLRTVIGDDRARLEAISPVHNAARLRIPVLLAHGRLDGRTPVLHARRLRDALRAHGNAPEYIENAREVHDFIDPAHRSALFRKILAFLALHLSASSDALHDVQRPQ